jgi:Ca-activated chloride channel family protein
MLRFQNPNYFPFLIVVAIVVGLFLLYLNWKKRQISKIGTSAIVQQQFLGFIPARATFRFVLVTLSVVFCILGIANLQKAGSQETVEKKGIDVMIALDVSKSMLATDITPNRLTRAKQLIERLTDKMSNDRVGLVIFAGKSYLQVPLTVDYRALKLILQSINPDMVPTQGTVISDAIALANKSFSSKEKKYKSIILISDGEDHDEKAINEVKNAVENGVVIHTIGVGSPDGVILNQPGSNQPKVDASGNPVITKLNEDELINIAQNGNGTYTLLNNPDVVAQKINSELSHMEQRNIGSVVYANYISYFQYFLGIALLLMIIEFFIPKSKSKSSKSSIHPKNAISMLFIFLIISNITLAQNAKQSIINGNKQYAAAKYNEALSLYTKSAISKDSNLSSIGNYNLGNTLYKKNQFDSAKIAYEQALKKMPNNVQKSQTNYNLGNVLMEQKKWQEAIEQYKSALRKNPQDLDAKYNLAYAQKMLKKDGGKGGDDNKDKKEQEDKKDQQKKDEEKKEEQKDNKNEEQDDEKENDQQKTQPQPSKLSEQQAEQLLNALQQEEKKLQEEKSKKKGGAPLKLEKDW